MISQQIPADSIEHHCRQDIAERRQTPRVPYDVMFQVAFHPGDSPLRFTNVWGHDLSPTGISFHSSVQPDDDEIVLKFGDGVRMNALVRHFREDEQEGRTVYLVGCEFARDFPAAG